MKLKLNDQGFAVVVDGKPVYVHDDGKEIPFDVVGTVARISTLNAEAKSHREAKEALESRVAAFAGIEDPVAAKKALETVRNLDDKKLVDAGKVEEVRQAAVREYEARLQAAERAHAEQLAAAKKQSDTLQAQLHREMIGGNFQRSNFIKTKTVHADTADLLEAKFGPQFKVVDGKLEVTDFAGNRIHSRVRPGDPNVDFEEAIEILVDSYPGKASILKGANASGSGSNNGGGGGQPGTITRKEFEALPPASRASALKDKTLVD